MPVYIAECAFCIIFYNIFCFVTMLSGGGGQEQLIVIDGTGGGC